MTASNEPDWSGLAPPPIAINDVVQIHPAHHCLGGALAFVTEVHPWGIVAEVPIPPDCVAPVRLGESEFIRIGKAPWEPATS